MSETDPNLLSREEGRQRLTSWKAIAAYFDRSVRTVQRWERESSLPVHRYPTRHGESVFALVEEIEEWARSATGVRAKGIAANGAKGSGGDAADNGDSPEGGRPAAGELASIAEPAHHAQPEPQQPRAASLANPGHVGLPPARTSSRVARWAVVVVVLLLGLMGTAWLSLRTNVQGDEPSSVKIDGDRVLAFDVNGALLWSHRLSYVANTEGREGPFGLIDDIDGDGHREVLVRTITYPGDTSEVLCFDWEGTLRWSRSPDRRARFGYGPMAAPWVAWHIGIIRDAASRPSVWVSWAHRPFFGSFAERVDVATGRAEAVYWSAGYVTAITLGRIADRPVVFLGAANNEHKAASLAVYDLAVTEGSAPASDPRYRCEDCPAGRPMAFFVFPKMDVARAALAETTALNVEAIQQDSLGQVLVVARQGHGAGAIYRFDEQLRPVAAEVTDSYRDEHKELERKGLLNTPFSPEEERQLFPILSWDSEKAAFVPISPSR